MISHRKNAPRKSAGKEPSQQEINMLVALFKQGRYAETETLARTMTVRFPLHGFGWKAMGTALLQQGRTAEALAPLQKATDLSQGDAQLHNNLGNTLVKLDRLPEAEVSYRQALKLNPGFVEAHHNLGNTLLKLGRLPEAEASLRRALEIKPDFAEAHSNLGGTLLKLGRLSEAEASFRRVLELNPNYADAHSNLGIIFRNQGKLREAEASYHRAVEIKPDYAEAHYNLGNILMDQGRLQEAEASYHRALNLIEISLKIDEKLEAKRIFVECARRVLFTYSDDHFRDIVIRAISEPWSRPGELAKCGGDLVKLNPDIGGCVARATEAWPQRLLAQDLFGPAGFAVVTTDPLLRALLDSTPICDIELERFLTMARRTMLYAATTATVSEAIEESVLAFYSALARQCFINEYVFALTDEETDQAQTLRDSLVAALEAETQIPVLWLVTVAAYFPLFSIPFAARLMDRSWPDAVIVVLTQQIREPEEERQYRTTMPRLTTIENEVSLLVLNQYEKNPYPRWVKAAPVGKPVTIDKFLRQRFPLTPFKPLCKSSDLDILIAGCGTGQHSIDTARHFQGARVLAVDLSLTSLCYAKRKTQELGLPMIEYAQADILKLGSLDRSFDVIESVGVLHHLSDPMAGWRVLLSLLRPGGFMRLGFYSEVARRDIVRARNLFAEQGYDGSTIEEIRLCRQNLMDSANSAGFEGVVKLGDFFSISACRDLLFHVQEHRMTLVDIESFLRGNNLIFLGFETNADVLCAYKRRFPDDLAATNLGQWHTFENENPDIFIGMYQFWVQKAG